MSPGASPDPRRTRLLHRVPGSVTKVRWTACKPLSRNAFCCLDGATGLAKPPALVAMRGVVARAPCGPCDLFPSWFRPRRRWTIIPMASVRGGPRTHRREQSSVVVHDPSLPPRARVYSARAAAALRVVRSLLVPAVVVPVDSLGSPVPCSCCSGCPGGPPGHSVLPVHITCPPRPRLGATVVTGRPAGRSARGSLCCRCRATSRRGRGGAA